VEEMRDFNQSIVKALLPELILKTVNRQPTHGYAFIMMLRKQYGIYLGPSTIYPLLGLLEKQGLIVSKWQMAEDYRKSARPQKAYAITAKGKAVLGQDEIVFRHLVAQAQLI
jgi:DNA-binding PadR family transcriptional regulator